MSARLHAKTISVFAAVALAYSKKRGGGPVMTENPSIREKRRAWDKLGAARAKEFRDAQAAAQAEAMLSAIEIEILLSEWAKAGVIQRAVISKGRYGRTSVVRWVRRK